jgi:SAM-dependent methyltransferase
VVSEREQRLVFGEVAELYDRARPGYPDALVDDVVAVVGVPGPALEIGAGTGKATAQFAARGMTVHAIEPNEDMAALARRNCAAYPGVTVEVVGFEDWTMQAHAFALVFAAQAWHWVRADMRAVRAADALVPTGHLALFWNIARPFDEPLQSAVDDAYRRFAPELDDLGPPARAMPVREDPRVDLDASGRFDTAEIRRYPNVGTYSTAEYLDLLNTHSDHRLLPPAQRAELLEALRSALDANGGRCERRYETVLYLARTK